MPLTPRAIRVKGRKVHELVDQRMPGSLEVPRTAILLDPNILPEITNVHILQQDLA